MARYPARKIQGGAAFSPLIRRLRLMVANRDKTGATEGNIMATIILIQRGKKISADAGCALIVAIPCPMPPIAKLYWRMIAQAIAVMSRSASQVVVFKRGVGSTGFVTV